MSLVVKGCLMLWGSNETSGLLEMTRDASKQKVDDFPDSSLLFIHGRMYNLVLRRVYVCILLTQYQNL